MSIISDNIINWLKLNSNLNAEFGNNGLLSGSLNYVIVKFDDGTEFPFALFPVNYFTVNDNNEFDPNDFIIEFWLLPYWAVTNGGTGASSSNRFAYWGWKYDFNNRIGFDSLENSNGTRLSFRVGGLFTTFTIDKPGINNGFTWLTTTKNHLTIAHNRTGIPGSGSLTVIVKLNGIEIFTTSTVNGDLSGLNGDHIFGGSWNVSENPVVWGFNGAQDNPKIYKNSSIDLLNAIEDNKNNEGLPVDFLAGNNLNAFNAGMNEGIN
jgi:hypothetical protein